MTAAEELTKHTCFRLHQQKVIIVKDDHVGTMPKRGISLYWTFKHAVAIAATSYQ